MLPRPTGTPRFAGHRLVKKGLPIWSVFNERELRHGSNHARGPRKKRVALKRAPAFRHGDIRRGIQSTDIYWQMKGEAVSSFNDARIQVEQQCRVQQQISRHLVPEVSPQSSRWRYRQTA